MSRTDSPHVPQHQNTICTLLKTNTFKIFPVCFLLCKLFLLNIRRGMSSPLHSNYSLSVWCPFLTETRDRRSSNPSLKPIYFPSASSQNFQTIILFNIVERSKKRTGVIKISFQFIFFSFLLYESSFKSFNLIPPVIFDILLICLIGNHKLNAFWFILKQRLFLKYNGPVAQLCRVGMPNNT